MARASIIWVKVAAPWHRLPAIALLAVVAVPLLLMVVAIATTLQSGTVPTRAANLGPWAQAPIPIRSPIELVAVPSLWLLRGDLTLVNARVRDQDAKTVAPSGPAGTPASPPPTSPTAVTGAIAPQPLHSVEQIVLTGARVWLNAGRAPRGTVPTLDNLDTASIQHLVEPLRQKAFEALSIVSGQITFQRPGSAGHLQSIDRFDAEIRVSPDKVTTTATGRFMLHGESVAFEASLSPIDTRQSRWSLPVRMTVTSRHLALSYSGLIQFDSGMRLEGRLELGTPSLAGLSAWLGHAMPDGFAPGPMEIKGDAIWRDGQLTLEQMQISLDGQTAQGALSVSVNGPRPVLDGSLAFRVLEGKHLQRWFGIGAAVVARNSAQLGPARLGLVDAVDADLRVSAAHLEGLSIPASHLALTMTARGGLLVADIAELDIAEGSAVGQLRVDQRGEVVRYGLKVIAGRVNLPMLLGAMQTLDPIARLAAPLQQGKGYLGFDLEARGRTWDEVQRALTGDIQLAASNRGILSFDIAALLADARERKRFDFTGHRRQPAKFDGLDVRLAVRQGAVVSEHISLRSDDSLVTADGIIQPLLGKIYLRVMTDHGQSLERTARLGRSQMVLVHGDLSNPVVQLEEATGLPVTADTKP